MKNKIETEVYKIFMDALHSLDTKLSDTETYTEALRISKKKINSLMVSVGEKRDMHKILDAWFDRIMADL